MVEVCNLERMLTGGEARRFAVLVAKGDFSYYDANWGRLTFTKAALSCQLSVYYR